MVTDDTVLTIKGPLEKRVKNICTRFAMSVNNTGAAVKFLYKPFALHIR